jgi:hypothetical protein
MRLRITDLNTYDVIASPITEKSALLQRLVPVDGDWRTLEVGQTVACRGLHETTPSCVVERLADPRPTVDYVTSAPANYDGFGTERINLHGEKLPDGLQRVRIDREHLDWQLCRYGSGLHPYAAAPRLWAAWDCSHTHEGSIPVLVYTEKQIEQVTPTVGSQHPRDLKPGQYTHVQRDCWRPGEGYRIVTLWPQVEVAP